jgi:hypothetical protein
MKTQSRFFIVIILAFFLFTIPNFVSAQYNTIKNQNTNSSFWDRTFFGGNLGLQFGTITIIDISPLGGYKVTDNFAAGLGLTYIYYNDKRFADDFSTAVYGGRVFGQLKLPMVENLFAHAEYELLNYDLMVYDPYGYLDKIRVTANNVLLGAGYRQPIGENASIDLLLLYNLNENENSLYSNPILRMGVSFGL